MLGDHYYESIFCLIIFLHELRCNWAGGVWKSQAYNLVGFYKANIPT